MAQGILSSDALLVIHLQASLYEALGRRAHSPPDPALHAVLALLHKSEDVTVLVCVEGRSATEHDVHDNAAAPDICSFRVSLRQHLRCDVIGRAHSCPQTASLRQGLRQPEILGHCQGGRVSCVWIPGWPEKKEQMARRAYLQGPS